MANFSLSNPGMCRVHVLLALVLALPLAVRGESEQLTLQGHVRAQDGKPMAGVVVRVTDSIRKFEQQTKTDDSGVYKFAGLQPGKYSVEASLAGFAPLRRSITLEGQPVSTDLVLTAAAGSAVPASPESRPSTAPGTAS